MYGLRPFALGHGSSCYIACVGKHGSLLIFLLINVLNQQVPNLLHFSRFYVLFSRGVCEFVMFFFFFVILMCNYCHLKGGLI